MSMATRADTQPPATARCRQPRPDPRAGRAGEQPQGRQRRDPEAPADGVHRGLRLGQELAGVRHHRRGVAADDQRDLQRLRAGIHADAGAARRRRARGADDRDHRRPGADGRQRPVHGRHRHRRQRDAAHPLQPARAAAHRLAAGVLVQHPHGAAAAARSRSSAAATRRPWSATFTQLGGMCPRCEGMGTVSDIDLDRALRREQVARRGRDHGPRLHRRRLVDAHLLGVRLLRPRQADPRLHRGRARTTSSTGAGQGQDQRHQHHLRGPGPEGAEVVPLQGRRGDAAAHPRVRGAGGHVHGLSRVRRHPAQRGGALVEDRRDQHRRRLRDADQRPGRMGRAASTNRRSRRCSRPCSRPSTRSSRSGSATSASTAHPARCPAARRSAPR